MQNSPFDQKIIKVVERVLRNAFSESVFLDTGEVLQDGIRASTYCFHLLASASSVPTSVIVKHVKSTDQAPYIPERAIIPAWTFFNEWASLVFLDILVDGEEFGPCFYGGDKESGLMVIEDLGQGKRLDDYLKGTDPIAAESALIEFAAIHGRLHAVTLGKKDEFRLIRESLGPSMLEDEQDTYEQLISTFHQTVEILGILTDQEVAGDLEILKQSMLHPGPFQSFIQNDSCADNCLFQESKLRLLDFEGGMFDHALKEGVYGRMHFPTCRYVYRIPRHIVLRMEEAYRVELAKKCSEANNERYFARTVAEACVFWMLQWYQMDPLLKVLENDRLLIAATSRQRYLLRSEIVAQTTQEAGRMEAIGRTIGAMAEKMRTLWPDVEEMPLYPAFRVKYKQ